jgi:hypothetical protein
VNLDQQERDLLSAGLGEWGGPARLTNALAIALGFTDETHLHNEAKRIRTLLDDGALLTQLDAARPLAATEIVFASDVFEHCAHFNRSWPASTRLRPTASQRAAERASASQRRLARSRITTGESLSA